MSLPLPLLLLSLLLAFPLPTFPFPISLPLRRLQHYPPSSSSSSSPTTALLASLAASSLTRANHLRSPRPLPLYPHSYGGYSISLGLGTPPQRVSLLLDTGSDLIWVPCTPSYLCRNCSFPPASSSPSTTPFLPKSSSSAKLVGCRNPKCSWIHSPAALSSCSPSAVPKICPPYAIIYGSGSTAGLLLSETLDLPNKRVPGFAVGCSIFSSRQPAGIAGFGRSPLSLPAQLGLSKFGYCLLSHRFDDNPGESGSLVLGGAEESLSRTPLLKNPAAGNRSAFGVYYYIGLRKILVGGKRVRVPYRYFTPGPDGSGGSIVDSGTTFTVMSGPILDLVAKEFDAQVAGVYNKATDVEAKTGLRPCFDLSMAAKNGTEAGSVSDLKLPELAFQFKGGARMTLPLANYFSLVGPDSVVCLTVVSDGFVGPGMSGGPSIVLGNFQQQNFYVEYDLEREKFGFRRQNCSVK